MKNEAMGQRRTKGFALASLETADEYAIFGAAAKARGLSSADGAAACDFGAYFVNFVENRQARGFRPCKTEKMRARVGCSATD